MAAAGFLRSLREDGHLLLDALAPWHWDAEAADVLEEMHADWAADLPGTAPALLPDVAAWAACQLYRGCQLALLRDAGEAAVQATFLQPCPAPPSAETAGSADLTFRFLPDLIRLATALAPGDILVGTLRHLAAQWPLSSASLTDLDVPVPEHILTHPSLARLCVDRLLAARAHHRLRTPALADLARLATGDAPDHFPPLPA